MESILQNNELVLIVLVKNIDIAYEYSLHGSKDIVIRNYIESKS
jgi:hypothetical protein